MTEPIKEKVDWRVWTSIRQRAQLQISERVRDQIMDQVYRPIEFEIMEHVWNYVLDSAWSI